MKLNILAVEHQNLILGPISYVFNKCNTCDTAHVKLVVKLLPNKL